MEREWVVKVLGVGIKDQGVGQERVIDSIVSHFSALLYNILLYSHKKVNGKSS